jgi:hypothetical protein
MKKIVATIILLISNIGFCQSVSSYDLNYFVNIDNSDFEKKIGKKGFVLERKIEHLVDDKLYYSKKFRKEQTGEWIEKLEYDKKQIQIWYSFIGVELNKNSAYKKFKNDFLFNEYILIHEAFTDNQSNSTMNSIKATLKNSNEYHVSLENNFTPRHFSNGNKDNDYTHWIKIYISSW